MFKPTRDGPAGNDPSDFGATWTIPARKKTQPNIQITVVLINKAKLLKTPINYSYKGT